MHIKNNKGANAYKKICRMICALLILTFFMKDNAAYAATEPTFKYTEETEGAQAYVYTVTATAEVRVGPGTDYKRLVDPNTNRVVTLLKGDRIAVLGEKKGNNSSTWYEVRWLQDTIEFHGYISTSNAVETGEEAVPLPTATPIVTETPTPSPTPTIGPTSTPTPTQYCTPTPPAPKLGNGIGKEPGKAGLKIVFGVLAIILAGYGIFVLFCRITGKSLTGYAPDGSPRPTLAELKLREKREQKLKEQEEDYRNELESYMEEHGGTRSTAAETALKEKEVLRAELDGLKEGDTVTHRFFGEGTVINNADENSIEVLFGSEVRSIEKESAAAKQLMRKL